MAAIRRRSPRVEPKPSKHSGKFFFFFFFLQRHTSENDPLLDNFRGLHEQNVSELNKVSGSVTPVGGVWEVWPCFVPCQWSECKGTTQSNGTEPSVLNLQMAVFWWDSYVRHSSIMKEFIRKEHSLRFETRTSAQLVSNQTVSWNHQPVILNYFDSNSQAFLSFLSPGWHLQIYLVDSGINTGFVQALVILEV